jgi:hypothetical protein
MVAKKPQLISLQSKPLTSAQGHEEHLSTIMVHLEQHIRECTHLARGCGSVELRVLFRLDSQEVKFERNVIDKFFLMLSEKVQKKIDEVALSVADENAAFATRESRQFVKEVLSRLRADKASSIEIVLIFKHAKLIGRREVLNSQVF